MNKEGAFVVDELTEVIRKQTTQKDFGWASLDNLEIGFNAGELSIIGGRPGHGKTTVILNILLHWLETYPDQHFIHLSFEIPPEAVMTKLLSALSRKHGEIGWSYHEVRRWLHSSGKNVPDGAVPAEIEDAVKRLRSVQDRLLVVYEPDWTVLQAADYVKELKEQYPDLGGVFVDYIQLVLPPPGQYESKEHEVSAVAKQLKLIGVRAQCPVVAAGQIGREAARVTDVIPPGTLEDEKVLKAISTRRPQLHHLREGGGEQEADLVVGMLNYRADFVAAVEDAGADERTLRAIGSAGPLDICVIKNRYGQLAVSPLILEGRNGYIRDPGVFGK